MEDQMKLGCVNFQTALYFKLKCANKKTQGLYFKLKRANKKTQGNKLWRLKGEIQQENPKTKF